MAGTNTRFKDRGYSVEYLKGNLNQATAYIHPLQNDVSFTALEGDGGLTEVSVGGVASPSNLPLEQPLTRIMDMTMDTLAEPGTRGKNIT